MYRACEYKTLQKHKALEFPLLHWFLLGIVFQMLFFQQIWFGSEGREKTNGGKKIIIILKTDSISEKKMASASNLKKNSLDFKRRKNKEN